MKTTKKEKQIMLKTLVKKLIVFTGLISLINSYTFAQIINVQTFEFQRASIKFDSINLTYDTTYSETFAFEASYTFDLVQNTLTSFIDNKSVIGYLIRYADLDDGTMVFVYSDYPASGWLVNTKTSSLSYFGLDDVEILDRITRSIFIVY